MSQQTIHVTLTTEAAARCRSQSADALRAWLLREYERAAPFLPQTATLFSTPLEVADDVPLLLAALSQLTGRSADELAEAWVMQLPAEAASAPTSAEETMTMTAASLSAERLGQLAEIIDLGETLFEQTVVDARQRMGGNYPESEKAERAMAQVFDALRVLLRLAPAKGQATSG